MSKLIILGIDSLDSILLTRFLGALPHFRQLREATPPLRYQSVFPPDSVTAWASIYTGLSPAKHGIVYFIDPMEKVAEAACEDTDNTPIKGRTFWDIASKKGKQVCLVFPLLGYPAWPVNGVMFSRSKDRYSARLPFDTYPSSLAQEFRLSHLEEIKHLPSQRSFPQYLERWRQLVLDEAELGLKLLTTQPWDLFFLSSGAMDDIEHNFWMYCDEEDPSYPGPNPFKDTIAEFYSLYDQVLGKFMEAADSDTVIMVLSDHGHGRRPTKMVNINELLRQKGFLVPRIKNQSYVDPLYVLEKAKRRVIRLVNRYSRQGIGEWAMWLMHRFPRARRLYTHPPSIDWEKTLAYVCDLSGIKAYSYGGIRINPQLPPGKFEEVREKLIQELSFIPEPESGENLVLWIKRREELYQGENLHQYPDLVFELRGDYGAGWEIHNSLFAPCSSHNIQPGSHQVHSPVLLFNNPGHSLVKEEVSLMDIAPSILSLLDIQGDFGFDGESFLG